MISKESRNSLRNNLKKSLKSNELRHKYICKFESWLNDHKLGLCLSTDDERIKSFIDFAQKLGFKFSEIPSFGDLQTTISDLKEQLKIEKEKMTILKNSIGENQLNTVTYSLPLLIADGQKVSSGTIPLALSGIRKNALEKNYDGPLMDETEQELLDMEKVLTELLNDDLSVSQENVGEFLYMYLSYISCCFFKSKMLIFRSADKKIFSDIVKQIHSQMIIYLVEEQFGFFDITQLRKTSLSEMLNEYYLGDLLDINWHQKMFEKIVDALRPFVEKEKGKLTKKNHDSVLKPKVTKIDEKPNPLEKFMTNGVVTKPCDLEEFKSILEEADLPIDKKNEYFAQMRNLINRNAQAKFDKKMVESRSKIFTKEEMELYINAKENPVCKSIIEDIDTVMEMLLDEVTEEDQETLRSELTEYFDTLRLMLNPKVEKEPEIEQGLIYYSDTVLDEGGNLSSIPVILQTALKDGKETYKHVHSQITKLKQGLTNGDGIVKAKGNWPCKVYYRGKDYKVYYTIIEDVVIVIDSGKRGVGIDKVVGSERFAFFIDAVKGALAKGQIIDNSRSEALLMEELEKVSTFKQKL